MSTIYDVASFSIDGGANVPVSQVPQVVNVTGALAEPNITIVPPATSEVIQVQVAGPQGSPGLQNVYIQSTDPAVQNGWGQAQKDFVWIQV